jgi:hypothetical protein
MDRYRVVFESLEDPTCQHDEYVLAESFEEAMEKASLQMARNPHISIKVARVVLVNKIPAH